MMEGLAAYRLAARAIRNFKERTELFPKTGLPAVDAKKEGIIQGLDGALEVINHLIALETRALGQGVE